METDQIGISNSNSRSDGRGPTPDGLTDHTTGMEQHPDDKRLNPGDLRYVLCQKYNRGKNKSSPNRSSVSKSSPSDLRSEIGQNFMERNISPTNDKGRSRSRLKSQNQTSRSRSSDHRQDHRSRSRPKYHKQEHNSTPRMFEGWVSKGTHRLRDRHLSSRPGSSTQPVKSDHSNKFHLPREPRMGSHSHERLNPQTWSSRNHPLCEPRGKDHFTEKRNDRTPRSRNKCPTSNYTRNLHVPDRREDRATRDIQLNSKPRRRSHPSEGWNETNQVPAEEHRDRSREAIRCETPSTRDEHAISESRGRFFSPWRWNHTMPLDVLQVEKSLPSLGREPQTPRSRQQHSGRPLLKRGYGDSKMYQLREEHPPFECTLDGPPHKRMRQEELRPQEMESLRPSKFPKERHWPGMSHYGKQFLAKFGFKRLKNLVEKTEDEIALELCTDAEEFKLILDDVRCCMKPDWLELILHCLVKCIKSSHIVSVAQVLQMVCQSSFLKHLQDYIGEYVLSEQKTFEKMGLMPTILDQIMDILYKSLIRVPSVLSAVMPFIDSLEAQIKRLNIKEEGVYQTVQTKLKKLSDLRDRQFQQNAQSSRTNKPLGDIESVNLLPTLREIMNEASMDLRPLTPQYNNAKEYIYTLFHLFRADFVLPLCRGLKEYKSYINKCSPEAFHSQNVYLFQNIIFTKFSFKSNEGLVCEFDFSRDVRFNKRNNTHRILSNKRFKFGSLLCLSSDKFEQELLYARVCETNEISQGLIGIHLIDLPDENLSRCRNILEGKHFDVLESSAFYGAYMPILKVLKGIYIENNDPQVPFSDYILFGKDSGHSPSYLQGALADFRPILNRTLPQFHPERQKFESVDLANKDEWPKAGFINLEYEAKEGIDESQYEAFQAALTKEFSLIQGPPGTGKTYIGLMIMKFLLTNQKLWNKPHNVSPILLVCYTNHALDQFLEGIINLHLICQPDRLVRVGSRSKSEKLSVHNLNTLRKELEHSRITRKTKAKLFEKRAEASRIQDLISSAFNGILHENSLKEMHCISRMHYHQLTRHHEYFRKSHTGDIDPPDYAIFSFLELGTQKTHGHHSQKGKKKLKPAQYTDDDEYFSDHDERRMEDDELCTDYQNKDISNNLLVNLSHLQENTGKQKKRGKEESIHDYWKHMKADAKQELLQYLSSELQKDQKLTQYEVSGFERTGGNIWLLPLEQRWNLYRYWKDLYTTKLKRKLEPLLVEYEKRTISHQEALNTEDEFILKNALVIGMTTTGAARFSHILKRVSPSIVIVEEAAEIMEAHAIASLSSKCKHLIQIGDHQQLQPNPNMYKLGVDYHLNISLFERMVKCNVQCKTLELQHRMRPEICSLLVPTIYRELKNHPSVLNYSVVKGITHSLYFIGHSFLEEEDPEIRSHSNKHEAMYAVRLCKYILQQGPYLASDITILSTYLGQARLIKQNLRQEMHSEVKVSTVDNYQGEENKIIILSLVRSNKHERIGFLSKSNRICVALSRAKEGLYLLGNFKLFSLVNETWKQIVDYAQSNQLIGDCLVLKCQNHPENEVKAKQAKDFDQAPEGGCNLPCSARLETCGHMCRRRCHTDDRLHKKYLCEKKCKHPCINDHKCEYYCWECKGGQECKPCMKLMKKIIPNCNHEQQIPCHVDPAKHQCKAKCNKTLKCGHLCKNKCGEPCNLVCEEKVEAKLPCGHKAKVDCQRDLSMESCLEKCETVLVCGHQCVGTCGSCLGGRLHVACKAKCERILMCGHECQHPCTRTCPPCTMKCPQRCWHNQCQRTCGEPCVPCKEMCEWRCRHHQCSKTCHELCDRPRCDKKCSKRLKCRHQCTGVCGEKCPKLCVKCDLDKAREIMDMYSFVEDIQRATFMELECGHIFETEWLDAYMKSALEGDTSDDYGSDREEGRVSIHQIVCPLCRHPIIFCGRYGNVLKEAQSDMRKVKEIVHNKFENKIILQNKLTMEINDKCLSEEEYQTLFSYIPRVRTHTEYINAQNVLKALASLNLLTQNIKVANDKLKSIVPGYNSDDLLLQVRLRRRWVLDQRFWDATMFEQLQYEIGLFQQGGKLIHCICILSQPDNKEDAKGMELVQIEDMLERLTARAPVPESSAKAIATFVQKYEDQIRDKEIYEEKIMLNRAMNFSSGGHWYKCQNGHVYAITECGGAMEESKCPECKETIGGHDHLIHEGNERAEHMEV